VAVLADPGEGGGGGGGGLELTIFKKSWSSWFVPVPASFHLFRISRQITRNGSHFHIN
jgi:hypothetical protein